MKEYTGVDSIKLSMLRLVDDIDTDTECEEEYLVPMVALKDYLDTDSDEDVLRFLREEYTSMDTENLMDTCFILGLEMPKVSEDKHDFENWKKDY